MGSLKNYLHGKELFLIITVFLSIASYRVIADVPAEVQAVFVSNGCLTCHGNSGGLSLADAATSEVQLVGVDATCNNNMTRVIAGDPDNSVLFRKISMQNPGCGGVMPPSGNLISQADQNTIFDWIVSIGPAAQFGLIQLEVAAITVQETDTEVILTVNRQLGTQGEVSVDYTVATVGTDTAISPDDYTADAGTLVFADGESVKTITVVLNDDAVFEGSEVFSVTLSNVVNGAVFGSQLQTKVTIQDNEFLNEPGTFFFNAVNYSVDEGDGNLDVTILRSFGAAGVVSVELVSSNGSAIEGMDYTAVNQVLEFTQGTRSLMVSLPIIEDTDDEGAETLTLTMSNPANGALLGNPASVTVTINDNDGSTGGGDGGGDGGGTGGGGDGGVDPVEPEEEASYEAAGGLSILLPLLLLILFSQRKRLSGIAPN